MEWNFRGDHLRHSHDNSRGDIDIVYELLYFYFRQPVRIPQGELHGITMCIGQAMKL